MPKGTIIIYWNATKYTKYTGITSDQVRIGDSCLQLNIAEGRSLIIPWTTINRVEIIDE